MTLYILAREGEYPSEPPEVLFGTTDEASAKLALTLLSGGTSSTYYIETVPVLEPHHMMNFSDFLKEYDL